MGSHYLRERLRVNHLLVFSRPTPDLLGTFELLARGLSTHLVQRGLVSLWDDSLGGEVPQPQQLQSPSTTNRWTMAGWVKAESEQIVLSHEEQHLGLGDPGVVSRAAPHVSFVSGRTRFACRTTSACSPWPREV